LVRSPKVYVRDSGVTHALLGIRDREELLGHPIAGPSFEAYAIEALIAVAPPGTAASFYRTAAGAEIDLVLDLPGNNRWAIEVKRSLSPKPRRGFHSGCADVDPRRRFVVYPGFETYALGSATDAVSLGVLCEMLSQA
jgi:predicted AAA+ superfamily ATPase